MIQAAENDKLSKSSTRRGKYVCGGEISLYACVYWRMIR